MTMNTNSLDATQMTFHLCVTRCHTVTSDASGKVKFHVPLSASLPKDVTKLSIKVKHFQINVEKTKILFPQAKAVNRKADNVTGMEQPVSVLYTYTFFEGLRQIFTFLPEDEAESLFFQEMKHDVSLSHEGGDLSLGLLKKEKTALPCNEVSPENSLKT